MIREKDIEGYNRKYTLEELKAIPQYKKPFGFPLGSEIPYYLDTCPNNLHGEIFKEYPKDPRVKVSNYGRVMFEGKVLKQENDLEKHFTKGWLVCPEYSKSLYVYQLVTDTWLPAHLDTSDRWARHHINNNGYDNRPENLIWLTWSEHGLIPRPYVEQSE